MLARTSDFYLFVDKSKRIIVVDVVLSTISYLLLDKKIILQFSLNERISVYYLIHFLWVQNLSALAGLFYFRVFHEIVVNCWPDGTGELAPASLWQEEHFTGSG